MLACIAFSGSCVSGLSVAGLCVSGLGVSCVSGLRAAEPVKLTRTKELKLDFLPSGLIVGPAGKRAVAFGGTESQADSKSNDTPIVALIDVEAAKILHQTEVGERFRAIGLDAESLYIFRYRRAGVILKLDPESLERRGRGFTEDAFWEIHAIPPGRIAVGSSGKYRVYDTQTMKPDLNFPGVPLPDFYPTVEPVGLHRLEGSKLVLSHTLLDITSGAVRAIVDRSQLPTLVADDSAFRRGRRKTWQSWGRTADGGSLRDVRDKELVQWRYEKVAKSLEHPMAVCLKRLQGQHLPTLQVDVRELITGEILATTTLQVKERSKPKRNPHIARRERRPQLLMGVAADRILTSFGRNVFVTTVPSRVTRKLSAPVRLQPPGILLGDTETVFRHTFAVAGGKPPYQLSVAAESAELHLDAKSGELTMDVPALWRSFVKRTRDDRNALTALGKRVGMNHHLYENLVREELAPDRLAFSVPFELFVTDSGGQEDSMTIAVLVRAPLEAVADLLVKGGVSAEGLRELQARTIQKLASRSSERPDLDAIEDRLDRLRAALSTMYKKVQELERKLLERKR